MESRTSNLSAEMCRHGDYNLRYGRASKYVFASAAPPLPTSLVSFKMFSGYQFAFAALN